MKMIVKKKLMATSVRAYSESGSRRGVSATSSSDEATTVKKIIVSKMGCSMTTWHHNRSSEREPRHPHDVPSTPAFSSTSSFATIIS